MRVVALEEHFSVPEAVETYFGADPNVIAREVHGAPLSARPERLADLGAGRVESMDEAGITVQVLSAAPPGADLLDGSAGVEFAQMTNDRLAAAVAANPERFVGFAHLPVREPIAAADELERAVRTLGLRGATVNGMANGVFLDDERFAPLLERAERLKVPLYLHPNMPPREVFEVYYDRLPGNVGATLAGGCFGWHVETGLHVLRLAATNVFDRHPDLTIIVGHMGESLPFMVGRASDLLLRRKILERPLADVLGEHLFITTSGFFTLPPFLTALLVFGIDRMMFSVDYPWGNNVKARAFLDSLPLSTADRSKMAHKNADTLLGLTPAEGDSHR